MRNESSGGRDPQQSIDALCRLGVGALDKELVSKRVRLADDAVCCVQLIANIGVEIDLSHRLIPPSGALRSATTDAFHDRFARPSRKCTRSGTGLAVAPLSLPERHAVPAMSRCAHL